MVEKILKHIPPRLKANEICRRLYWKFMNFMYYCITLPYIYLHYKYESSRLKKFKDIHKGQRCFIIGNGPSILQQDLTKLKNEITFVVGWFLLHEQYNEINPTYYCMLDSGDFLASANSEWYQLPLSKARNTIKFIPLRLKPIVKWRNFLMNQPVFYINHLMRIKIWETGVISLDVTKGVYTGGGTIIIDFCLPLAFYMGFSEIYLLGCDCDYKLDEAPDFSKAWFYGAPEAANLQRLSVKDNLVTGSFTNVMKSYSVAKEAFEGHGRKIYNAGIGGKLEVFERVNYDELF